MDPAQLLIVTAAVSGATGGFVQQSIASGGDWLRERFAHHRTEALRQAGVNGSAYLDILAYRVQRLEDENDHLRTQIDRALQTPDVALLLQQAFLAAAQTEQRDKHTTLATIVAERLRVESDSLEALASQMAAEAVSHLAPHHLCILGFHYTLDHMHFPAREVSGPRELERRLEVAWAAQTLLPYVSLQIQPLDLLHLNAAGCLTARHGLILAPSVKTKLEGATNADFDYGAFLETPVGAMWTGAQFQPLYEGSRLSGTEQTSAGSVIGMYAADQFADRPSNLLRWRFGE